MGGRGGGGEGVCNVRGGGVEKSPHSYVYQNDKMIILKISLYYEGIYIDK